MRKLCFNISKEREVVVQQPPVLSSVPTIHFNQSLFSELSCLPPSSFACTSSYLNQSFHFSLRLEKAIMSELYHYCSQLHDSSRTLYGSCGWREVSDFPCLPRPASCSPRSGPQRTSPRSERLQNNRGITAVHVWHPDVLDGHGCNSLWHITFIH